MRFPFPRAENRGRRLSKQVPFLVTLPRQEFQNLAFVAGSWPGFAIWARLAFYLGGNMPVLIAIVLGWSAFADSEQLRFTPEQILKAVAEHQGITLRENVPVPKIFFESSCSLQQFQDAVEPQWNLRPPKFVNVYVVARNEIYLIDASGYYRPRGRFLDDSLAHEFAHFLQVKYKGFNLDDGGEDLEAAAVDVQTWFRENYL